MPLSVSTKNDSVRPHGVNDPYGRGIRDELETVPVSLSFNEELRAEISRRTLFLSALDDLLRSTGCTVPSSQAFEEFGKRASTLFRNDPILVRTAHPSSSDYKKEIFGLWFSMGFGQHTADGYSVISPIIGLDPKTRGSDHPVITKTLRDFFSLGTHDVIHHLQPALLYGDPFSTKLQDKWTESLKHLEEPIEDQAIMLQAAVWERILEKNPRIGERLLLRSHLFLETIHSCISEWKSTFSPEDANSLSAYYVTLLASQLDIIFGLNKLHRTEFADTVNQMGIRVNGTPVDFEHVTYNVRENIALANLKTSSFTQEDIAQQVRAFGELFSLLDPYHLDFRQAA